jgi:hypothetical protein
VQFEQVTCSALSLGLGENHEKSWRGAIHAKANVLVASSSSLEITNGRMRSSLVEHLATLTFVEASSGSFDILGNI